MLELDIFNHEMSSSQSKPVQNSQAMVGFTSDKICMYVCIFISHKYIAHRNTVIVFKYANNI